MNYLSLLPLRVWLQIAAVAVLMGLAYAVYDWAYDRGADHVQAKWDKDIAEQAIQSAKLKADTDKTSADLRTLADNQRKAKNAQIERLNADLAGALNRLSNRPARPTGSDVPSDTRAGAITGCTGAELYRPDGEFLTREAARADRLRADLAQCQAAHAAAREALN